VIILGATDRLNAWRVITSCIRAEVFEDKVDVLKRKMTLKMKSVANQAAQRTNDAEQEVVWKMSGELFENIPKLNKDIAEVAGQDSKETDQSGGAVGQYQFDLCLGGAGQKLTNTLAKIARYVLLCALLKLYSVIPLIDHRM